MGAIEWADVVRFTVVIPSDYLNESRLEAQNLVPSVIPQEVTGKNPVLRVRYLWAIVSTSEGRQC